MKMPDARLEPDENDRFPNPSEIAAFAQHRIEELEALRRDGRAELVKPLVLDARRTVLGVSAFAGADVRIASTCLDSA